MRNIQAEQMMLDRLKNPFPENLVKWRVGKVSKDGKKAIALAYIDARDVIKRLDEVCGMAGWQSKQLPFDKGFVCEIGILINDQWVFKSDASGFTNIEAVKGGASGALKRAASAWGVGRYLYYLKAEWVAINEFKQIVNPPKLPKWALPNAELWEDAAEAGIDQSVGMDSEYADEVIINKTSKIAEAYKNSNKRGSM